MVQSAASAPDIASVFSRIPDDALSLARTLRAVQESGMVFEAAARAWAQPLGLGPKADLLSEQVRQYQQMMSAFERGITGALARVPTERFLPAYISSVVPMMSHLADRLGETARTIHEVEESDFPFKWAGSLPAHLLLRMFEEWKAGDLEGMYAILVHEAFADEDAEAIVAICRECPVAEPVTGLVADAVWAHQQGKFSLSVPVFMAQTEGVVRRVALHLGVIQDLDGSTQSTDWQRVGRVLELIEERLGAQQGQLPLSGTGARWSPWPPPLFGAFVGFLREHYFKDLRNPVMHGNVVDYGTEELSVECGLALYEALESAKSIHEWAAEQAGVQTEEDQDEREREEA
jgi:hypothetical protein